LCSGRGQVVALDFLEIHVRAYWVWQTLEQTKPRRLNIAYHTGGVMDWISLRWI